MLAVHNVTDAPSAVHHDALRSAALDPGGVVERITGSRPVSHGEEILLPAYAVLWLTPG